MKAYVSLFCAAFALSAAGCTQAQLDASVTVSTNVLKIVERIGQDIVTIDCQNAALIQVIAKDAGAAARVQNILNANAQIAKDACPSLTGSPAVQVTVP